MEYFTGLLEPSPGFVCAYPAVASTWTAAWTQKDIIDLVTDPSYTPAVKIFDDHWVKEGIQAQHNSCAGWGGSNAFSKTCWLLGNKNGIVYSGSYPYSLCNNNVDQGAQLANVMSILMSKGTPPASMCGPELIWRGQTKRFDTVASLNEGIDLYGIHSELELAVALAQGSMVVVCIQVSKAYTMPWKDKTGLAILKALPGNGNHCIHCDDIRWNEAYSRFEYRIVNNWGLGWGYRGTGWVTFASFATPIKIHKFYRVTATTNVSVANNASPKTILVS